MALGIEGLRVGHWTSPQRRSGCTVLLPPEGTVGAISVRGGAPGTREAAAMGPNGKVSTCHAVVLSGGSAYGLATADGVMRWLETRGIGYPIGDVAVVPIVPAAIVLDAAVAMPDERPGAAAGEAACEAAGDPGADAPVAVGSVGVGTGCTIAKIGGLPWAWRGGVGTASATVRVEQGGSVTVAALVANNALGELVADDGSLLAASRAPADQPRYPNVGQHTLGRDTNGRSNTVIGAVITDAPLDKPSAARVADLAHSGIVRSVRPAHTSADGDALFCLATGGAEVGDHPALLDLVAAMAADVVAAATRNGPLAATTLHDVPALADHRER